MPAPKSGSLQECVIIDWLWCWHQARLPVPMDLRHGERVGEVTNSLRSVLKEDKEVEKQCVLGNSSGGSSSMCMNT